MNKKLLIDAAHAEEVRVAVVDGNHLEEFDSESSGKRQTRSNVYLAKVVRIEPSLQAAFVDYGEDRHGFLPFAEIHPDYYRVPIADREALAAEKPEEGTDATDSGEEEKAKKLRQRYRYKIQEVIQKRQILLVQVAKEQRGNKGAALTTYLSLAGRYCVLMPNAGTRGGGISRKINDDDDRKRLKEVLKGLEVPEGMSLIVRTAGGERSKAEIKRDYDYLTKLWEEIREKTLGSIAPCLIQAEGDLIKRAIRDIYRKEIQEILVEGDAAYKEAKAFMKLLAPSHAKKVQAYKDSHTPLFHKFKVEQYIDQMMFPQVTLPSGGSIVINHTEALVSIDVNSGRSTKERNIEVTALKTNIEAAQEIARQLRLRDLAGLIVIDFIDMEENSHVNSVEKKFKEAVKSDRARIQVGRISQFGLLELSRQRLRPSMLETHSVPCAHCHGTGTIRSTESLSLQILRATEREVIKGKAAEIQIAVPENVALYLLNRQRRELLRVENRYRVDIFIVGENIAKAPYFRIDTLKTKDTPDSYADEEETGSVDLKEPKTRHRRGRAPEKAETPPVEASIAEITPEAVTAEATPVVNPKRRNSRYKNRERPDDRAQKADVSERSGLATETGDSLETATKAESATAIVAIASEARAEEKPAEFKKNRGRGRGGRNRSRQPGRQENADNASPKEAPKETTEKRPRAKNENENANRETPLEKAPDNHEAKPKKKKNWLRKLLE